MDTERQTQLIRYELVCSGLPLAVYREIAAHLRQVEGVNAGLTPQQLDHFDYCQSQVGNLWIQYAIDLHPLCQEQVGKILEHYSNRLSPWMRSAGNVVTG